MLEKTIKAIQEMDAVVIQADATKKKTFEYINANYRSKSELMNQKIEEMDAVYNETCEKAAEKVRVVLEAEIQDARAKIDAVVCTEVPNTFSSDLAVIQARQGNMSDYELELYVNKYLHNYPAIAALHSALAKDYAMIRMMRIVKPERLIDEMEQRRGEVLRLISAYDPTGYCARLLRTENNPIVNMAARIQAFVNGDFMVNTNIGISGSIPV